MQTPREDVIAEFGRACTALRDHLEGDVEISATEQLYIENCFTMIELCYVGWKHRDDPPSPPPSSA